MLSNRWKGHQNYQPSLVGIHAAPMSVILGFAPRSLPARLATVACRHSQAKLVRQFPKRRTVTTQRSTGIEDIPLAYTWLTKTPDEIVSVDSTPMNFALAKCLRDPR